MIRIKAAAIERLVVNRFQKLLRSHTEFTGLLQPLNRSASRLREVIQKAQETAAVWNNKSAFDQSGVLQTALMKVRLLNDQVELQLSRRGLVQIILEPTARTAGKAENSIDQGNANPDEDQICIQTANCLEPSANGLRLLINDASQPAPNMRLTAQLGKAFALREPLLQGPHDSIEALSNVLQMSKGFITSRIRLTFLSPNLIRIILNGDMPNTLSPTRLLEASKDLPLKWVEQDRFIEALTR